MDMLRTESWNWVIRVATARSIDVSKSISLKKLEINGLHELRQASSSKVIVNSLSDSFSIMILDTIIEKVLVDQPYLGSQWFRSRSNKRSQHRPRHRCLHQIFLHICHLWIHPWTRKLSFYNRQHSADIFIFYTSTINSLTTSFFSLMYPHFYRQAEADEALLTLAKKGDTTSA